MSPDLAISARLWWAFASADAELVGDVDTLASLCVYSISELAMIGMSEEQACAEEIEAETGRALVRGNARSR
jgi:hypothetical protein